MKTADNLFDKHRGLVGKQCLKAFPVYVGSPIPCHAFGALGTLAIPLFQRKLETL